MYSSLPARGVWIEITCSNRLSRAACRSPQGECGLKLDKQRAITVQHRSRSPQGECGLKCQRLLDASRVVGSLPARGVWIEIAYRPHTKTVTLRSLPARGVWIEISSFSKESGVKESLPARGVWIEIPVPAIPACPARSLPARGVWIEIFGRLSTTRICSPSLPARGVWIEIGRIFVQTSLQSLPARGVWIEITPGW